MGEKMKVWISFVLLIVFSVFVYKNSLDFPGQANIFPIFIVISVIFLSILMVIQEYKKQEKDNKFNRKENDGVELETKRNFFELLKEEQKPLSVFGISLVYIYLIPRLGFFFSMFFYIPIIMILLGIKNIKYIAIIISVMFFLIYFGFVQQLGVNLPDGMFF